MFLHKSHIWENFSSWKTRLKCSQTIILKKFYFNHVCRTNVWNWIGWLGFFEFRHGVRNPCVRTLVDHIVGLYGKTFLATKIWEIGQKQEFPNWLKTLVLETNPEKLKIDQKCFSWVSDMNRMNKLNWIKLVCYDSDM